MLLRPEGWSAPQAQTRDEVLLTSLFTLKMEAGLETAPFTLLVRFLQGDEYRVHFGRDNGRLTRVFETE